VLANTVLGFIGFALACVCVHVTAPLIGKWPALAAGLAVSIGYSLIMWQARRLGLKV
jgi:hypothetical protein